VTGRCVACDAILTEQEMKYKDSNEQYITVCFACQTETKLAEDGYYDNAFNRPFVISDFGIKETYKE